MIHVPSQIDAVVSLIKQPFTFLIRTLYNCKSTDDYESEYLLENRANKSKCNTSVIIGQKYTSKSKYLLFCIIYQKFCKMLFSLLDIVICILNHIRTQKFTFKFLVVAHVKHYFVKYITDFNDNNIENKITKCLIFLSTLLISRQSIVQ